jgi:hypothetical protein
MVRTRQLHQQPEDRLNPLKPVGNDVRSLTKLPPAWHAEAKQILRDNFASIHQTFLDSTNKAIWLGLFLEYVKTRGKEDGSIKHGEFGPWLEREVPEVPWRTARTYMSLARGVAEKGQFQIGQFSRFAEAANLSFLQILNAEALPPQLREFKERVDQLVAGKTQQQLFLEFKQTKDGEHPARGRMPGDGGRPAAPVGDLAALREWQRKESIRRMGRTDKELTALDLHWTVQNDDVLHAFLGILDKVSKPMRKWVNTPPERRDLEEIKALWKTL